MQLSYDMKNYGANAPQDLHCSLHHRKLKANPIYFLLSFVKNAKFMNPKRND